MTLNKWLVLDDDPTGTQECADVAVLLDPYSIKLESLLNTNDVLFVLTNTRALAEKETVELLTSLKMRIEEYQKKHKVRVNVILRGDSTLRGHIKAELSVFDNGTAPIVFSPAFPKAGRITKNGVHYLVTEDSCQNVVETEFAKDPVFSFNDRSLTSMLQRIFPKKDIVSFPATQIEVELAKAGANKLLIPDVSSDEDIALIGQAIRDRLARGNQVLIRCAASLASTIINKRSLDKLTDLTSFSKGNVLVVCGSHTKLATAQIEALKVPRSSRITIETSAALSRPEEEAKRVASALLQAKETSDLVVLETERTRLQEHNSLQHGQAVMNVLIRVTSFVAKGFQTVISKGGITSSEISRIALGSEVAVVSGQLDTGISLFQLDSTIYKGNYVVVPGNVGNSRTIASLVNKFLINTHYNSVES